jgi:hypothetical protein
MGVGARVSNSHDCTKCCQCKPLIRHLPHTLRRGVVVGCALEAAERKTVLSVAITPFAMSLGRSPFTADQPPRVRPNLELRSVAQSLRIAFPGALMHAYTGRISIGMQSHPNGGLSLAEVTRVG